MGILCARALFMDQQVRKNAAITLKLGFTDIIHNLKIILLQYFQLLVISGI